MVRPEVRIIEPQQEETRIVDASQSERDFLLAKYGYKTIDHPQNDFTEQNNLSNLSFEEMISLEEQKNKERSMKERQKNSMPNPYSFDRQRINYYEDKYSDLGVDGSNFGINVRIVSDMPIDNNRNRR
jgi:hypothetical protein